MAWFGSAYGVVSFDNSGTATLTAGTVTISDAKIKSTSHIECGTLTAGGTQGAVFASTKTAGTSFVLKSTSSTDTSVVWYRVTY